MPGAILGSLHYLLESPRVLLGGCFDWAHVRMEHAFSEGHVLEWPSSLGSPRLGPACCLSLLWQGWFVAWGGPPDGDATAGARPRHLLYTGSPTGSPERFLNFRALQINRGTGMAKAQGSGRVSLAGTSFHVPLWPREPRTAAGQPCRLVPFISTSCLSLSCLSVRLAFGLCLLPICFSASSLPACPFPLHPRCLWRRETKR